MDAAGVCSEVAGRLAAEHSLALANLTSWLTQGGGVRGFIWSEMSGSVFVHRLANKRIVQWGEVVFFALVSALCGLAWIYYLSSILPLDGGFQSFAMLLPISMGQLPGVDFIPYLVGPEKRLSD
ncbi:MAG: hypothetical protein RIC87_21335 [Kiloniellales bacterium]